MKIAWRKNVLVLVGSGYFVTLVVFIVLVAAKEMKVSEAYDIIAGPLMALIGGSLAIAKDLIGADDESIAQQNRNNGEGGQENGEPANVQEGE